MLYSDKALEGKVALITGASRGIGREMAITLAKMGASIGVNFSRNVDKANEVVAEIKSLGVDAIALQFDVSDFEQVDAGVTKFLEKFSKIDILINNAGIASDGLLMRTKPGDWQKTIDINLNSCFYLSKAVSKPMMKARVGRIINISSVIGQMGNAGQVAYAASKAGIFGLTKSLAKELGSRNITVNSVAPGYIETDMTSEIDKERIDKMLSQIPAARLGSVEDVANLVAFLASDQSSYITGQTLAVNGGMYL